MSTSGRRDPAQNLRQLPITPYMANLWIADDPSGALLTLQLEETGSRGGVPSPFGLVGRSFYEAPLDNNVPCTLFIVKPQMIQLHASSRAAINLIVIQLLVITIAFADARSGPRPVINSRHGDGGP